VLKRRPFAESSSVEVAPVAIAGRWRARIGWATLRFVRFVGAILRVEGVLYERELVRISEGPLVEPLLAELSRKYLGGRPLPGTAVTSGSLWLFELAPRG
jgi:hypothetical protein